MRVDEKALAEDLGRASEAARATIELAIRKLEAEGVAVVSLRPCEAEARDGTKLGGCAKHYIPQPDGRWGAVFSIELEGSKPVLVLLAAGERHPPRPWKPSVYEIAHRRFNRNP
ncbi:MAG TPA: hypothetical protein VNL97_06235 [Solirubrobacterales bacterium]|nr:hypothetical protein [Solirubrobacterales bacterium]